MKTVIVVCALAVVVLQGCGSSASMNYLNPGVKAEKQTVADSIKVYSERNIGREYIELGSVSASFHDELDGKVYVKRIRAEAAKIGADAIVGFEQIGTSAYGVAVKFK